MGCTKSSPSDSNEEPTGFGDKIIDCYKDAYVNQTNASSGHHKFMDKLEDAFPGLNLNQVRHLVPTADRGVTK